MSARTACVIIGIFATTTTTGAPMAYRFEGKQYIIVAVGSQEGSAQYVALALP